MEVDAISLQRKSKWQQKKTPICHKFEEQVEKTREETNKYWDMMALPKRRIYQKKPKPIKKNKIVAKTAYKLVDERDKGRCQFPGCYKTNVNHHHVLLRSQGGKNDVQNLILLCTEHHTLGKNSPHKSIAWQRYWEGYMENIYPEYWRNIRESKWIKRKEVYANG